MTKYTHPKNRVDHSGNGIGRAVSPDLVNKTLISSQKVRSFEIQFKIEFFIILYRWWKCLEIPLPETKNIFAPPPNSSWEGGRYHVFLYILFSQQQRLIFHIFLQKLFIHRKFNLTQATPTDKISFNVAFSRFASR